MAETTLTVADGLIVSLEYTLRLDDGTLVDTSANRGPLEFLQGQGQIIPGLERALYGMAVGDEKDIIVMPADAHGDRDPAALQIASLDSFPPEITLEREMGIRLRNSSGRMVVAFVVDILPEGVLLDFNHPLAGQTLHFYTRIAALRKPTEKELEIGYDLQSSVLALTK